MGVNINLHPYFDCSLTIEIIEANDGVNKTMDVVTGCDGPLEAESVEYLYRVVVIGFNPSHLVSAAQIVCHQRTQQGDKIGIFHHPIQCLLKLFFLHVP